jgi:hypothetical protein
MLAEKLEQLSGFEQASVCGSGGEIALLFFLSDLDFL